MPKIGITSFLINRMWFGKAVDDFNLDIVLLGANGPKLEASIGNGFTSTYFLNSPSIYRLH